MVLDPKVLWSVTREMDDDKAVLAAAELTRFYNLHKLGVHSIVMIPSYWASIVLEGLTEMVEKFPQLKLGSILESKHRLVIHTVPTHRLVENLKYILYNKIDILIMKTIDDLLSREKRPYFLP